MQQELLLTLLVFWSCTTAALVVFLRLWFSNTGESFHPHSVEIMPRHQHFVVVRGTTQCRRGFVVQSISAFVAPRGSSSNKSFTVIGTATAVTGFLGSMQWYGSGDANFTELLCSLAGFLGLLLVCITELDVSPERFLDEKFRVVAWLAQRLMGYRRHARRARTPPPERYGSVWAGGHVFGENYADVLPFPVDEHSNDFRDYICCHEAMLKYFEDDLAFVDTEEIHPASFFRTRSARNLQDKLFQQFSQGIAVNQLVHMIGCITYVGLTTYAIVLNDPGEKPRLAVVVAGCFMAFSVTQMLSGAYMPLPYILRGWVLPWNPFFIDEAFMTDLDRVLAHAEEDKKTGAKPVRIEENRGSARSWLRMRRKPKPAPEEEAELFLLPDANVALDHALLQYARSTPKTLIDATGHVMVMFELFAVLAPCVALGLQWITSTCDGPVPTILADLLRGFVQCAYSGSQDGIFTDCPLYQSGRFSHCVFATTKEANP